MGHPEWPYGCDEDPGYSVKFAHLLSSCGWVFSQEKVTLSSGVYQSQPTWFKDGRKLTVSAFHALFANHPWCRSHVIECLKRGAVGFQMVTPTAAWDDPGCVGSLSPLLTVEWPDAVTRLGQLGEVSADRDPG